MAFFNLTHLGPQDPFKTASKKYTEGENQAPVADRDTVSSAADPGHASCTHSYYNTMYSPGMDPSWHKGSHLKYTEMLKKHQKSPEGPTQLYTHPMTTTQTYGWWTKPEYNHPEKESWVQNERHTTVNSEMTRFVDEMSLTNREFSLF